MSDISLTASMRSNLLSLQNTQSLMDMTQERLSSGKKVNSAIDNPSSYYTSQSLNNRASDLSSLLDSMGQGIQTIKAANQAIESITAYAQQAKSLANSARDIANNMKTKLTTTQKVSGGDTLQAGQLFIDTRTDKTTSTSAFAESTATVGGTISYDIKLLIDGKEKVVNVSEAVAAGGDTTLQAAINAINGANLGVTASANAAGDALVVESDDGVSSVLVSGISGFNPGTATDVNAPLTADPDVTPVAIANGSTIDDLITSLNTANTTAQIDPNTGKISVVASNQAKENGISISVSITGDAATGTKGLNGTIDTRVTDEKAIAQRNKYVTQYNSILEQIDNIAKDAGYKGINLLKENDLKVIFNEDRSSIIEVKGVNATSNGLGLEELESGAWNLDTDIDKTAEVIDDAISELRAMSSDFGNNYSIVQSRENFTDSLVNVLTEGADKLTLADMNEESANMLALQTRQQLAINSLSLASQSAQSVLKLFG